MRTWYRARPEHVAPLVAILVLLLLVACDTSGGGATATATPSPIPGAATATTTRAPYPVPNAPPAAATTRPPYPVPNVNPQSTPAITATSSAALPRVITPVPARPATGLPPSSQFPTSLDDMAFTSRVQGWVLTGECSSRTCTARLAATRDGGATWQNVAVPQPLSARDGHDRRFSQLAFANAQDGWAFDPSLFSTHDGGRTWREEPRPARVYAVTPVGTRVWMVEGTCDQQAAVCRFQLYMSGDMGRTWSLAPGQPSLQGLGIQLVALTPSDLWIHTWDERPSRDSTGLTIPSNGALVSTHDGARTWNKLYDPCWVGGSVMTRLAALDRNHLWMLCGGLPSAGNQIKTLFASSDGGKSWSFAAPLAGPDSGNFATEGYIASMVVLPPQVLLAGLDRDGMLRSTDGGQTWPIRVQTERGEEFHWRFAFADAAHGWALTSTALLRTDDAGASWQAVNLP